MSTDDMTYVISDRTGNMESERAEHLAWLEDFNQRQQEHSTRTHRIAFLNGWLERDAQVKDAPTKK